MATWIGIDFGRQLAAILNRTRKVARDKSPSTKAFGVVTEPSIQRLDGKVAIVTGGGKGIGRSEALLMAQQGAKVVVSDVGVDDRVRRADTVVSEINEAGGHAVAAADDLATFDGARQVVATALDHFGGLDIVINNAGLRAANAIQDITDEDFDIVVGSHLKATYGMIKYAAPIFLEQGSGVILNTSSESGLGHPYNSAYAAAKEGITGLTRTVARELGTCGVRCNQIRPRAEGTQSPEFMAVLMKFKPQLDALGRFTLGSQGDRNRRSLPEDVAALAVWLCTDAAAMVNGHDFFVMGDVVGLWSEPELVRATIHTGGWTLNLLDEHAPDRLIHGLHNRFTGN
jgi:NAD(P)-dependent dehydrogenase (short-subunit alcohol dehydrogenase family)